MHKVFKDGIFGLNTAFHGRLGVWVFNLYYLAGLSINVNNTLACAL